MYDTIAIASSNRLEDVHNLPAFLLLFLLEVPTDGTVCALPEQK
jgi:hypothetical protein